MFLSHQVLKEAMAIVGTVGSVASVIGGDARLS
jgi:hypothetical protein